MFTSESKIRVRYAETDQMGVVYHSHYFPYFESARAEAIRQLGLSYADMERDGVIMPVVEVHARYLRPARYDELLTIRTSLRELPLHHKIDFHHEVISEAGDVLVTGQVILYFLDAVTRKRRAMPDELREKLQPYFT